MRKHHIKIEDFFNILVDYEMGIVGRGGWQSLVICHGARCLHYYEVDMYPAIRTKFKELKNVQCVYAYFSKDQEKKCIYIGVSKNLNERLYQHLLESCEVWGHHRYKAVFSQYQGELDLYYLPIGGNDRNGDYLRSIIEKILQAKYNPILASVKL